MDLDDLLHSFFGTSDLESLPEAAVADGCERIGMALATEGDPGRRFALWALLHGLGAAPDPAATFEAPGERAAAIAYARAIEQAERG